MEYAEGVGGGTGHRDCDQGFSHVEVVFVFHRVEEARAVAWARHPRGNVEWPRVGIFTQRGKDRPNRIGVSVA